MEGSFSSRVDQAFGALGSAVDWRVSEQDVERKGWKLWERNYDRDDAPCASYYEEFVRLRGRSSRGGQWERDLDEVGDSDAMDVEGVEGNWHANDTEEEARQMRLMIGLDSTLDLEDEEDMYDKVAVGREEAGERIYMKEVKGSYEKINTFNILPDSLKELKGCSRDPRANHLAARERLEEDAKEAASAALRQQERNSEDKVVKVDRKRPLEALDNGQAEEYLNKDQKSRLEDERQICDNGVQLVESHHVFSEEKYVANIEPPPSEERQALDSKVSVSDVGHAGGAETSHLERNTERASAKKPVKRVRFALDTPEDNLQETEALVVKKKEVLGCSSVVPDYIKNPSKYIHYTLDWSNEDDDMENLKAFEACRQFIGCLSTDLEYKEEPAKLPQKIEFRPRPRESSATNCEGTCYSANGRGVASESIQTARPIGIAAGYKLEEQAENLTSSSNDLEYAEMDVADETVPEEKLTRGPRKYRSRIFISEN